MVARHTRHRLAIPHIVEQDDEFIATLAADRVGFADTSFEPFDNLVTGRR